MLNFFKFIIILFSISYIIHIKCLDDSIHEFHVLKIQDKLFKCSECEYSSDSIRSVTRHQIVHTDNKPYVCNSCGKQFRTKSSLNNHENIHNLRRPYECDICEKTFTSPDYLRSHKKTHTNSKKYDCSICLKSLSTLSNLNRHINTHLNKIYKCHKCDKHFRRSDALKSHFKKEHFDLVIRIPVLLYQESIKVSEFEPILDGLEAKQFDQDTQSLGLDLFDHDMYSYMYPHFFTET